MQIEKYTEKYTNEIKRIIAPLFLEKPKVETTHRCAIHISSKTISLVHINRNGREVEIVATDELFYDDFESLPLVLHGFIERHQLQNVPTYLLLGLKDYQLFLIESLPVSAEEFKDALRWRVRSLINFPIEQAIIDDFKLPAKKATADNMIAAVVARSSQLSTYIDFAKRCDLTLSTIDISELAMRNLTSLYEDDEKSTAFIYFFDNAAILNITRQKTLYFTRRIEIALQDKSDLFKHYEQFSLDILRYFDYFQSQWRHPSPTRIFVGSDNLNPGDIASKLSESLLLTVQPFKIKSLIGDPTKLHALEQNHLLTLGCALREEGTHATTGN